MPRDSLGVAISQDVSWVIALRGQIYIASDADQNDRVTGQTSYAATTPTFMRASSVSGTTRGHSA